MVEVSMGILLAGCYATRELVGHGFRGSVVLLRPREPQLEWPKEFVGQYQGGA